MTRLHIGAGVAIAAIGAAGLVAIAMPRPPVTHKGDLAAEAPVCSFARPCPSARAIRTIPIERPGAQPQPHWYDELPNLPASQAESRQARQGTEVDDRSGAGGLGPSKIAERTPAVETPIAEVPELEPRRRWHWHDRWRRAGHGGDICARTGGKRIETHNGKSWRCLYSRR